MPVEKTWEMFFQIYIFIISCLGSLDRVWVVEVSKPSPGIWCSTWVRQDGIFPGSWLSPEMHTSATARSVAGKGKGPFSKEVGGKAWSSSVAGQSSFAGRRSQVRSLAFSSLLKVHLEKSCLVKWPLFSGEGSGKLWPNSHTQHTQQMGQPNNSWAGPLWNADADRGLNCLEPVPLLNQGFYSGPWGMPLFKFD